MAKRTKLKYRELPDYSKGEEICNMTTHIVGAVFGVVALVLCIVFSSDVWAIVSSSIYGASLIAVYTISSVYHGLHPNMGKKVMQVLDHCSIYFMIGGCYTPVLLCAMRPTHPGWAWSLFGVVWALCAFATVFTAIDLEKYETLSQACYIGIGWCIIIAIAPLVDVLPVIAIVLLVAGGLSYTIGAVLYKKGQTKRYIHSLFHVAVLIGSALHFVVIFAYVI